MSQPQSLTPREQYIKGLFFPKLMDEDSSDKLVRRISSIGGRFGFIGGQGNDERRKHKYDTWIANQVKRELSLDSPPTSGILDREEDLFHVMDWAAETKPNLTSFTFEQAVDQYKRWIKRLKEQGVVRSEPIEEERILYRYRDGYFIYILKPEDLDFEGNYMGHCVGGDNYKNRIRNQRSIILSLRDKGNNPHVTIEVVVSKGYNGEMIGTVSQQFGRGSKPPKDKYHAYIREFSLFSCGALNHDDAEFLSA